MVGSAKTGEKIFISKCAQCHAFDKKATPRQGPNLSGLLERNMDMAAACWYSTLEDDQLDLKKDFSGLTKPQDCTFLTSYLKEQQEASFSVPSSPVVPLKIDLTGIQKFTPEEKLEKVPPKYPSEHPIQFLINSIRSLSGHGRLSEGFKSFSLLQHHHSSSSDLFHQPISSLLGASTNLKAIQQGKQLHACIMYLGLHDNPFLISRLSSFYSTVGPLLDAKTVVEDSSTRYAFPWNILISAYARKGLWLDAILAHRKMVERGIVVDKFTYPSFLRACGGIPNLHVGRVIHGSIEITGLQHDLFIQNALVSMYAKCEAIEDARKLFDSMSERDVVSWNSLIFGYSLKGMVTETLELLEKMQSNSQINVVTQNTIAKMCSRMGDHLGALKLISDISTGDSGIDSVSLISGLDACSRIRCLRNGKEIHGLAFRLHSTELENVTNALITMYSRCKQVEVAYLLFRMAKSMSLIAWNAMIAGLEDSGYETEAPVIFREMIQSQIKPNFVTLMTVVTICARVTNLHFGLQLHCYTIKRRFKNYQFIWNSLIDMYSKCGKILAARRVFNTMSDHDKVSYTSLIHGYGMQGRGMKALILFAKMLCSGVKPDSITMVAVLSACSHSGLFNYGQMLFENMMLGSFEIAPEMEHYSCMVELFGQAGLLSEAEKLIYVGKFGHSTNMLATLVKACRTHRNKDIGQRTAYRLLDMRSDDPRHYVLIASMFAYCGNWNELSTVKVIMRDMGF